MKIPHEKFCILPWVSLETSPIGTVRPCCLADDELVDNAGNKFNLSNANFKDIQNSHDMQKLRQEFINGQQPKTCRKCWNEESAGRTSKRMHSLDRLKHMILDEDWTKESKPLQFLDLKLGNICNLKCRICGSWSSSTFATEELQALPYESRKSSFHYEMLKAGAWPRTSTHFWSELADNLIDIRYLEFTGGEPFMIEEHFDLLRSLIDADVSKNIEIHYNTNGTHWPVDAIDIWEQFRHVEIAFSIDDVGARFEYQRSNAVWSEVCGNIERFRQLRNQKSNLSLQVCSTVNIFNVYYLEELAQWIDQQNFDFVYWNIMHDAPEFSIANMPEQAKQIVTTRLLSAQVSPIHQQEFIRMVDFMRQGAACNLELLHQKLQQLDQRRNENLATVAPELALAIGYQL